jgi:hypothetical protein
MPIQEQDDPESVYVGGVIVSLKGLVQNKVYLSSSRLIELRTLEMNIYTW